MLLRRQITTGLDLSACARELERARRNDEPVTVLLFRATGPGHAAPATGLVETLRAHTRPYDVVGDHGGIIVTVVAMELASARVRAQQLERRCGLSCVRAVELTSMDKSLSMVKRLARETAKEPASVTASGALA